MLWASIGRTWSDVRTFRCSLVPRPDIGLQSCTQCYGTPNGEALGNDPSKEDHSLNQGQRETAKAGRTTTLGLITLVSLARADASIRALAYSLL